MISYGSQSLALIAAAVAMQKNVLESSISFVCENWYWNSKNFSESFQR